MGGGTGVTSDGDDRFGFGVPVDVFSAPVSLYCSDPTRAAVRKDFERNGPTVVFAAATIFGSLKQRDAMLVQRNRTTDENCSD